MIDFQPRYVTFDLYGTLTAFGMSALTRELFSDRIPIGQMEDFVKDFAGYRIDEVLGAYKPYRQVIKDSLGRTAARWGVDYRDSDGLKFPFRLRRAIGTDTIEETTFDRFKLNSKIDPKKFEAIK